jgi:hypothetical protein
LFSFNDGALQKDSGFGKYVVKKAGRLNHDSLDERRDMIGTGEMHRRIVISSGASRFKQQTYAPGCP